MTTILVSSACHRSIDHCSFIVTAEFLKGKLSKEEEEVFWVLRLKKKGKNSIEVASMTDFDTHYILPIFNSV
ncbi:hypothetical protein IC582_010864 [Cucumis melo]